MRDIDLPIQDIPLDIAIGKHGRKWRYPQILDLSPGKGIFIPKREINSGVYHDPSHSMRALVYERRKATGRNFRVKYDPDREGVWVYELEKGQKKVKQKSA